MQKSMNPEDQMAVTLIDNDLPEGWESTSLKTVATLKKGKKPYKVDKTTWPGAVPYIDIEAFEKGNIRRYADQESSALVNEGDIIVVWDGARCGHVGKAPKRGALGSTLGAIEPVLIHPDYILRFLQSSYDTINTNPRGIGIPHVEPELFWNLEVPLPPLAEQKRIVAKVEELLTRVNATKERLAKVSMILKRFRQSVLAAACSGRLTVDWRQGSSLELEEWKEVVLKDVAELRLGKMLDKAKNIGKPTRYLRNLNVRWFSFDLATVATMRATPEEQKKLEIRDGDLLVCEGGEPGRCAVWNLGTSDLIFQKAIHRIQIKEMVTPHWLAFNIRNDAGSAGLEDYFTGTTIKHLTGRSLAEYRFSLPSLVEQHEIVRRVETLFKLADTIEKRVASATARADKLPKAILAKALRGELVPTEAELARRDRRPYESASELLARIKSDRESKGVIERQHRNKTYKGGS